MNEMRHVLVVGAGGSVADCMKKSLRDRPPLDRGFFRAAQKDKLSQSHLRRIESYFEKTYTKISLADPTQDTLEGVMVRLYTDLFHPKLKADAYAAFLSLLRLFNRRLATTTNDLDITRKSLLYRIIRSALLTCGGAANLTIVTFNQDIQIEKALNALGRVPANGKLGRLFAFPHLYQLSDVHTTGVAGVPQFDEGKESESDGCVRLLKLHGSLNWYSTHNSATPPRDSLFKPQRKFEITRRMKIDVDMKRTAKHHARYTIPVVIPPVNHKASILHDRLAPLWSLAEDALIAATHVTVFGYSCPEADFESSQMFTRAFGQNTSCENLAIIDLNPRVFVRYAELTGMDSISYFKNGSKYLEAAASIRRSTRSATYPTPPSRPSRAARRQERAAT